MRSFSAIAAFALATLGTAVPAFAAPAAPKPAPPCTMPALPSAIATRVAQLGGIGRFGCFVSQSGGQYIFKQGRIEAVPPYGPNATYALVIDANDPLRIMHLYLSGTNYAYSTWIVRLTVDGALINQVTYKAGDTDDISGNSASDILVHPGVGRHGAFDVALEGCTTYIGAPSSCMGWSVADYLINL